MKYFRDGTVEWRVGTVAQLQAEVYDFVKARDWDKKHNAKDIAIDIVNETSELLEAFVWKSENARLTWWLLYVKSWPKLQRNTL